MIFLAGLPSIHYQDVVKAVVKAVSDEPVTGLQTVAKPRLTAMYAQQCIDTLKRYHSGRENCFLTGLTTIVVCEESESSLDFCAEFFPFSLVRVVIFARKFSTSHAQSKRDKNELARSIIQEVKRQVKIKNTVNSYLQSRLNRTPLLLPMEHFGESALIDAIRNTWINLPLNLDSNSILDQECTRVEKLFPFKKRANSKAGCFSNRSDVWFSTPGRDLHGTARAELVAHPASCCLNGILRFSGAIREGFHYDCTRAGGLHSGSFQNCHGEVSRKVGKPHLNVYPNDFVR